MASIPGPRETDAEDVALALEVAQSQWARGDHAEALKWLRKAADAAFDADDDKRGIELSKLAAELSAQDKVAPKPKPKLPPPRDPGPAVKPPPGPPRAAAPQIRMAPPGPAPAPPPAPEQPPSRRGGDPKLSTTGARRAASAKPADARPPQPSRSLGNVRVEPEPAPPVSRRSSGKSLRKSAPEIPDEESTREYVVADAVKGRAVDLTRTRSDVHAPPLHEDEEWPTETVDNLDDLEPPPEHTQPRATSSGRHGEARDAKKKGADRLIEVAPARAESRPPPDERGIPFTQALRVAVARAEDGRIVVRLLDEHGLRDGERDAMLVALTGDGLTTLFR